MTMRMVLTGFLTLVDELLELKMNNPTINIYRLINPTVFRSQPEMLQLILGTEPTNREYASLEFSPSGSFIYNNTIAAANPMLIDRFPAPETEREAVDAAKRIISECNQRRNQVNQNLDSPLPDLFREIVTRGAFPIIEERRIVGWNVKFQPELRPSTEAITSPVLNAHIVVTIGAGGRLSRLDYDWLPIEASEAVERLKGGYVSVDNQELDADVVYLREPDKNICAPYLLLTRSTES